MYKCEFFKIEELVPEDMLELPEHILWGLFDDRVLRAADALRRTFGPAIINDYIYGGDNHYRGYRPFEVPIGAEYSQHRFGRALDMSFKVPAEEVRQYIIAVNKSAEPKPGLDVITALELEVSWVHIDVRYHQTGKSLLMFHK